MENNNMPTVEAKEKKSFVKWWKEHWKPTLKVVGIVGGIGLAARFLGHIINRDDGEVIYDADYDDSSNAE